MKWVLRLLFFLNIMLVLLTILAYVSPFVDPSLTWFFSFFGLGFPILMILNFGFIIFWLMIKPSYLSVSLLTLLAGFYPIQRTIGFNWPEDRDDGFKVMSYNIGHSKYYLNEKEGNAHVAEFRAFIEKEDPDIICLQERARADFNLYNEIFKGYTAYPDEFIGTCVYSKWPVRKSGNLYFDTNAHNASWVDVEKEGRLLRVYSVHLSSNKVKKMSDDIKEMWDESKFILDKYNFHAIKRTEQLNEILQHLESIDHPVIVTGDFNDVPQSYLYRLASGKLNDAFIHHGTGLVKTHNSFFPGLRIDYAFHSPDIKVLWQNVLNRPFSDHYALVTSLDF